MKEYMARWVEEHTWESDDGWWYAEGIEGPRFKRWEDLNDWLWEYILDHADLALPPVPDE